MSAYNKSIRLLFLAGGALRVILEDANRQFEKIEQEHKQQRQTLHDLFPPVKECPCGCGLKANTCEDHLETVRIANEEIPF